MTDQHDKQAGAAESEPNARSMRTVAMTALGGTSIEWYDFFIYGTAAALVFPVLFFSDDMPRYVSLLASFSTFAVGFLARLLEVSYLVTLVIAWDVRRPW